MSGHSKWSSIRHKKGAVDAKRGKIFTKLIKEITVAARMGGGGDPGSNPRLRTAILAAKTENMPKENIERAIKKGTGELEGVSYEESIYEGYGPGGAAVLIESLTDNKNRTVSDVRHTFSRLGGNLGSEGCVAWMFSHKGQIVIDPGDEDPEEIALEAIDAGAEDVEIGEGIVEIYTQVEDFKTVQEALTQTSYEIASAELAWIPQTTVSFGEQDTVKAMKLLEALEDIDDVQEVYSNLDIPDDVIAKYETEAA